MQDAVARYCPTLLCPPTAANPEALPQDTDTDAVDVCPACLQGLGVLFGAFHKVYEVGVAEA